MASESVALQKAWSRVFTIEGQVGPNNAPLYHSWASAGAVEQPYGDVTRIEVPSQVQYGAFDTVGEVPGEIENATLTVMFQDRLSVSEVYALARKRCAFDVQIHHGQCQDPRDFDGGWNSGKIRVLERARITTYSTDDLGTLTSGDNEKVTEEVEMSALRLYEIAPITFAERATGEVTSEIIKVLVCDTPDCGDCGEQSDGCQRVFAIAAPAGSSPGLLPEVIYSEDGLTTTGDTNISTLAAGEDPDDAACVGQNLVVVSADSDSLHYADLDDILDGSETWAEVTSGIVATKGPRCISSYSPRDTWLGAEGGYIYFTADPTNGVTVQDAGVATTQDLNAIHAFNTQLIVAVGNSNVVVYSENGGDAWQLVVGPAVGINLSAIFIRKESEWWVGTANGRLYYSLDKGVSWTEKTFPGSGAGRVDDIVFATDTVGYLAHATATPAGRILRTISGGYTWYVAPEGTSSISANDRINSLAVCYQEPNVVFGGGLADNAADGILVKGS